MHTLEKGTTKILKGCLQSEAQTHSLTEKSRLTTALQRQREAREGLRASPRSKQEAKKRHKLQVVLCLLVFLIPSLLGDSGV